ncbi:MAG TPA: hypothetical protein VII47_00460, partial [Actinomycetota bacterium]
AVQGLRAFGHRFPIPPARRLSRVSNPKRIAIAVGATRISPVKIMDVTLDAVARIETRTTER